MGSWRELFPTKFTFVIFIGYMSLFIGQGIFVTASQSSNSSYNYNTVTVVLLTEILKLLVSISLYCRQNNLASLMRDIYKDSTVMFLYCVPALLYCLYNNLAFVNLATFDPTTYYLLLQLRVVITGVLFQIIFKKYLSRRQWMSLCLLTAGCMVKQLNIDGFFFAEDTNVDMVESIKVLNSTESKSKSSSNFIGKNTTGMEFNLSFLLILAQTVFSCLAGVYNEYLLKNKGSDVNIYIQNVFMYVDSIVCNALILFIRGELFNAFTFVNISMIFRFNVLIIIINNAAIGIVTSFFLKYMNSILKTFASALELMFTAVLCYILFNLPIHLNTVLAIGIVSVAIYLYSQSPVVNLGKIRRDFRETEEALDKEKLLKLENKSDIV